jgi:hypothetical protein
MKNKIILIALICLAVVPSLVFALGEVAGPVVIHVPLGGSGVGMWGLGHNETVNVKLRVEGNASQYITLPTEVTLPPTGIYWVNVTAKIPSNYSISQGTNITGVMYAVLEGTPSGQVQINLQLKKNVFVIVEQPKASPLSFFARIGKFFTGFFALQPNSLASVLAVVLIVIIAFVYFTKTKKGVNK